MKFIDGCRCTVCNRAELVRAIAEQATEMLGFERRSVFSKQKFGLPTSSIDRVLAVEALGSDFLAIGLPQRHMREWSDPTAETVLFWFDLYERLAS